MVSKAALSPILGDDNLTRGLGDAEARVLIEWLVERTDSFHNDDKARAEISLLCRRARDISRFVLLWCYNKDHGGACQLAATERFAWPFPPLNADPCDLMIQILAHELDQHGDCD